MGYLLFYYEIIVNQIRRMQMSFRFRCKGVWTPLGVQ